MYSFAQWCSREAIVNRCNWPTHSQGSPRTTPRHRPDAAAAANLATLMRRHPNVTLGRVYCLGSEGLTGACLADQ
jgi:hypothetical protein